VSGWCGNRHRPGRAGPRLFSPAWGAEPAVPEASILTKPLATIASERGGRFDRSFDLVDRLLAEFGEADMAERLYAAIPSECPWEVVSDLFGILLWSTSDNGAALSRVTEGWLRVGEDLRRVRVALHLDSYPFGDRSEMEQVLRQVAAKQPDVAARCEELIESRRRSPG